MALVGSWECTVWSQHECWPAPMSHLPAILLQQAISGSLIWRMSAAQAIAGRSVQANRTANASQRAEILPITIRYPLPRPSRNRIGTVRSHSETDSDAAHGGHILLKIIVRPAKNQLRG